MPVIVELISSSDTVTFLHAPGPDGTGYVYNNATLDAWYRLAQPETRLTKRPNAHGTYSPGQIFTAEHRPVVNGQYYGTSAADAQAARERLAALFSDGRSITMRVIDDLRTTTRTAWVADFDAPFHYGHDHFDFDMVLIAPDPRRYGAPVTVSTGLPSVSTGLIWNLGTAPSGLYWDWGTAGSIGQISLTNVGNTTTYPRLEVGAGGEFAAGFRITEVETGRELTFERPTIAGEVVVFDSRTQRATIAQGDVTIFLTSRDWFEIPQGQTRRYQINPLGSVTGSPTLQGTASPAYT